MDRPDLVAVAFPYFLARQPPVADEILIEGLKQSGTDPIAQAFLKSGRPALIEAVKARRGGSLIATRVQ